MKSKKIVSVIMSVLLMCSMAANVKAEDGLSGDSNTGEGKANSGSYGFSTWNRLQSGYRFVVVDDSFREVSNVVDLVFSDPKSLDFGPNNKYMYLTSRAKYKSNLVYRRYTVDKVYEEDYSTLYNEIRLHPPIDYSTGSDKAWGEEFKQWFIKDASGISSYKEMSSPGYN